MNQVLRAETVQFDEKAIRLDTRNFANFILLRPTFYISAYLEARRKEYYHLLQELDGPESWNRWISFFLEAITVQARDNTEKALGIISL